jgi:Leucine-rich repeat (LRR) protein
VDGIGLDQLHADDQAFVAWLAGHLRHHPERVLASLLESTGDGAVATRIADGRIVALDLRAIGRAMRWAVGEASDLELPTGWLGACEELDCSGMSLDTLATEPLASLRVLLCGDNRIKELDGGACPRLERLECAGNRLMVLDLRACTALRHLDCSGNQLAALVLPEPSSLEVLRCSRNQLMVLEVVHHPRLVELVCPRNALQRLEIGDAPQLALLDCRINDLTSIDVDNALPSLESLSCRENRLASLPLDRMPSLVVLDAARNYLGSVDLRPCERLVRVDVHKNQLERLVLVRAPSRELDCGQNRLRSLDLTGCGQLEILRVADNDLGALDLSQCPALAVLDCAGNRLESLDLAGNPAIAWLSLGRNPLPPIDLSSRTALFEVLRGGVEVRGDPAQMDLWFSPPIASPGPAATPGQLHRFARNWRGPGTERHYLEIVRLPQCDLGTALLAYWTSSPLHFPRQASREEIAPWEADSWDLLVAIEERVRAGGFARRAIPFDPRCDRQTRTIRGHDWTSAPASGTGREIPAALYEGSGSTRSAAAL